jgi:hypothetical protein
LLTNQPFRPFTKRRDEFFVFVRLEECQQGIFSFLVFPAISV